MRASLALGIALATSLALPAISAAQGEGLVVLPRIVRMQMRSERPVCEAEGPRASASSRCIEVFSRLSDPSFREGLEGCVRTQIAVGAEPDGHFELVVEVREDGAVQRADVIPDRSFATTPEFYGCVEGFVRGRSFDAGVTARARQRWYLRVLRSEHLGRRGSPVHFLGELGLGLGVAIWPGETREGAWVGLRVALFYDWFFGVSASFDSTDSHDLRPGAAVLWSVRYAIRPELRLDDEGTFLWGAVEAGVAMSSGQGAGSGQHEDEVAFSGEVGIGLRLAHDVVLGLYLADAVSASTHRIGGHVSVGTDFHL